MKNALITGITGQDGAYLAEHLLGLGYKVVGAYRRTSSENFWRIQTLGVADHPELALVEFDLTDLGNITRILEQYKIDEVYNLAAQSFVGVSFESPSATGQITGIGVTNVLEAIRLVNTSIRFYQASTSEMFGEVQEIPQRETTPFYPRSPYGVAKLYGHWMTINYRESYGIFASSGILFNHESPLRGKEFVTRKITDSVARIKTFGKGHLALGNMDAKRDWGFAKEYVQGMHKMLQVETPDTFVLSTGVMYSVREFVEKSFGHVDINIEWKGEGEDEIGLNSATGETIVRIDPKFYRPAEVELLIGDASKAKEILGWEAKTELSELASIMVDSDMERVKNGQSF